MARLALDNPAYYINREASWLAFNRRVLEEAQDGTNPLLERLKFLSISASNLDEFFEVRVAGLVQQIEDGYTEAGPDGLTLVEERDVVSRETHEFVDDQYRCWNDKLRPALSDHGIRVLGIHELDARARAFIEEYCEKELDLLLTPVTVDPAHPFPRVINKALCVAFLLRRRRRSALTYTGVVTVPRALPRLVRLPSDGTDDFIFLADLVAFHASRMYHGYDIVSSAAFRVTRNSNLYLAEEESRNLLESVRTELHNRRKGDAVRLEIEADADPEIIERLRTNFELETWQVFSVNGPVNLSRLFNIYEQTAHPEIKFKPFSPRELRLTAKSKDLFEELRRHDVLLHHPFDSYDAVVSFIEAAAKDPRVLSIKQTLYRTNEHSLIVPALISAAEKKEVTAVVELKARFDEDTNIRWARDLEDAGVQVFHGLVGLKTHSKVALVVRREGNLLRRYVHIGTGNYNPKTARLYVDIGLLTCRPEIGADVTDLFNVLTGLSRQRTFRRLIVAPHGMRTRVIELIDREIGHAAAGRPARIVLKINAIVDPACIEALYRASNGGVDVELIVRGICSLQPGLVDVSERIRVRSVVGEFLEHSRIWGFNNGGDYEWYIGSADLMERNLDRRIEAVVPVEDAEARARIAEVIATMLADDRRSWQLGSDAVWRRTEDLNHVEGTIDTFAAMKERTLIYSAVIAQPRRPGLGSGSLDPRA